jgi:hypothetical protein
MTENEVTQVVLSQFPQGVKVEAAERHDPDEHSAVPYWKVRMIHEPADDPDARATLLAIVNDESGQMTNCFWCIG